MDQTITDPISGSSFDVSRFTFYPELDNILPKVMNECTNVSFVMAMDLGKMMVTEGSFVSMILYLRLVKTCIFPHCLWQ